MYLSLPELNSVPASKEGVLGTCGLDTVERVEGVGVCGSRRYRSRRCRGAWPRIRRGEKAGRGEGVLLRDKSEIT